MTQSPEDLEARLRRVLDQAARQLQVPPVAWQAPSPAVSRRRLPRPGLGDIVPVLGVVVAVLIVVLAAALMGHQHANPAAQPNANPLQPPPRSRSSRGFPRPTLTTSAQRGAQPLLAAQPAAGFTGRS
jgi:hypothetical protein